jgi:hypothetical protein
VSSDFFYAQKLPELARRERLGHKKRRPGVARAFLFLGKLPNALGPTAGRILVGCFPSLLEGSSLGIKKGGQAQPRPFCLWVNCRCIRTDRRENPRGVLPELARRERLGPKKRRPGAAGAFLSLGKLPNAFGPTAGRILVGSFPSLLEGSGLGLKKMRPGAAGALLSLGKLPNALGPTAGRILVGCIHIGQSLSFTVLERRTI